MRTCSAIQKKIWMAKGTSIYCSLGEDFKTETQAINKGRHANIGRKAQGQTIQRGIRPQRRGVPEPDGGFWIIPDPQRVGYRRLYNLSFNATMILVLLFGVALGVVGIILLLMQLWAIGRAVPPIGAFTSTVRRRFLAFFATWIPLHSKAYIEKINLNQAIAFRKFIDMCPGLHRFS